MTENPISLIVPESKETEVGPWQVMQYARIGETHHKEKKPYQDRLGYKYIPEKDLMLGCVADGISWCSKSHIGAEAAVNASMQLLEENIEEIEQTMVPNSEKTDLEKSHIDNFVNTKIILPLVDSWKEEIRRLIKRKRHKDFEPYQATLAFAAMTKKMLYVFCIGDIIAAAKGNEQHGRFSADIGGPTPSLITPNITDYARYGIMPVDGTQPATILLATDGILQLPTPNIKPFLDMENYGDFISKLSDPTNDDISALLLKKKI